MQDDYYKTLKLTPESGYFQIYFSYVKQIKYFYSVAGESHRFEDLSKLTRAFEVLKREEVRKYYDILHREKLMNTFIEDKPFLQKYITIIEDHALIGNQKAEKLLEDPEQLKQVGTILSYSNFLKKFLFYRNPNLLHRYLLMPILCLIYLLIGIVLISMQFWTYNRDLLVIGIISISSSSLTLIESFRQYVIDEANK
jgi:hypothetical protein